MAVYNSYIDFLAIKTGAAAKITAIDAIIDALLLTVLKAVEKGNVSEYMLNDGQSIIKTVYRSPIQVTETIEALRMVRQQYMNDITGRVHRAASGDNVRNWRRGCN